MMFASNVVMCSMFYAIIVGFVIGLALSLFGVRIGRGGVFSTMFLSTLAGPAIVILPALFVGLLVAPFRPES